jgi:hypothetical protein
MDGLHSAFRDNATSYDPDQGFVSEYGFSGESFGDSRSVSDDDDGNDDQAISAVTDAAGTDEIDADA